MKCLNFVLCLLLSVSLAYGQSGNEGNTITVTTTIKENPNGGYTVHSIAESDTETDASGDSKKGGDMANADSKDDLPATVASTAAAAVEKLGKTTSKVKAGPDGEGDLKLGGFPKKPSGSSFPPIIMTIGEGSGDQRFPGNATVLTYKNKSHFRSSLRKDLSKAVDRMLR